MSSRNSEATILVVDDNQLNVVLLDRLLTNEGYRVISAYLGEDALDKARNKNPDLILLDIEMPHMDGYEVCRRLKEDCLLQDIPVIFISALSETDDKVRALSAGGVDYVTKPFKAEEVLARIAIHLKIRNLQKQLEEQNSLLEAEILRRKEIESHLKHIATTDSLTKVYNRRHFYELASKELSRSIRTKIPLSVIMLDIDHFKKVNDSYGHLVGDQVLIRFVQICQQNLRTYDILCRYGGEEFAVLLPDTEINQAPIVAERLRKAIESTELIINSQSIFITASFGIANLDLDNELSLESILDRADQALYKSKQLGRNCIFSW
jgi:diguanylate cyclase (GGDEF)-like protein